MILPHTLAHTAYKHTYISDMHAGMASVTTVYLYITCVCEPCVIDPNRLQTETLGRTVCFIHF